MFENFIYGVQASAHGITSNITELMYHPVIWGFALGFLVSTGVHLYVVAGSSRSCYHIITKSAKKSYDILHPPTIVDEVHQSFDEFVHDYNRVQALFSVLMLLFFAIVFVSLLRY